MQRTIFWFSLVPPCVFLGVRFISTWRQGIFVGFCLASFVLFVSSVRSFDPLTVPSFSSSRLSAYFLKFLTLGYAALGIYLLAITTQSADDAGIEKKYVALGSFSALVSFKLAALTYLTGDGMLAINRRPE